MVPAPFTMNGKIKGDVAYVFGERIDEPELEVVNNEIRKFSAKTNQHLISKVTVESGIDGRKVALVCLGTNPNISLGNIDHSYRQKTRGLLSLYWGDNRALGGNVAGTTEWAMHIEKPQIIIK